MDGVLGEPGGARHVRPRQLARSQHRCRRERRLDLRFHRLQEPLRLLHPAHQRPACQPQAQQIGQQLLHPAQGEVLLLDQVDGQGTHARPILRPAGRFGGKHADTDLRAVRAAHVQRSMLAHQQAHFGRQLVDLPPLAQHHLRVGQRRLTLLAVGGTMFDHLVRRRHQV